MKHFNPLTRGKNSPHFAFMSPFSISNRKGGTYLRRLRIIQTPWFGLYLHHIDGPDPDEHPHDHPYVFWSWVLKGSYLENRYDTTRPGQNENYPIYHLSLGARARWTFKKFPLNEAHKIEVVNPDGVITLLFVGKRVREFKFYENQEGTVWHEYVKRYGKDKV